MEPKSNQTVASEIHLSDERLIELISGEEFTRGQEQQQNHFDRCGDCQKRMESLAADAWLWGNCRSIVESTAQLIEEAEVLRTGDDAIVDEVASNAGGDVSVGRTTIDSTSKLSVDVSRLLQPPTHPELAGRLNQYEIESVIGHGGMGVVFKAYDTDLHRSVAIKMLLPHLANHQSARQRFLREARSAAAISHEHVIDIYQVRSDVEHPYLAMTYVPGVSLGEIVESKGSLPAIEVVRFSMQIASGLAAAHEQGVIHRDIKPANILLQSGGQKIVITDFGLARTADDVSLTRTGLIAGTPQYMSPEQCNGGRVNAATDLFSLGCVMYFLAVGRPPFDGENPMAVLNRVCSAEPKHVRALSPEISKPLANIIHRLLEKRPADRFKSASEAAEILRELLAHLQEPESNAAPNVPPPPSTRKKFLRKPTLIESAILMTAAICIGVKVFSPMLFGPTSQPTSAPTVVETRAPANY
ncbi:MAG: serine/threonine-protein kinase [Mariniblastus sp.]